MGRSTILPFTVPLGFSDFRFAGNIRDSRNSERAYLQALAARAVSFYCRFLKVKTNLPEEQDWPLVGDIVDLQILDQKTLGCYLLEANAPSCSIVPTGQIDRLGYVVVTVDVAQKMASLLGFIEQAPSSPILVSDLPSLSALMSQLEIEKINVLQRNLENHFQQDWTPVEELLVSTARSVSFDQNQLDELYNSAFSGSEEISLDGFQFALSVGITPETSEKATVVLVLSSLGETSSTLPSGLTIAIVDDFEEADAEEEDAIPAGQNFAIIKFEIQPIEPFIIRLAHGTDCIIKKFLS